MLLNQVILGVLVALVVTAVPLRIITSRMTRGAAADWVSAKLSGLLIIALLVLMATRSLQFGVDTAAYLDIYTQYCDRGTIDSPELSFFVSAVLINWSMLGACESSLLPAVWAGFIASVLLLMRAPWRLRLRYTALLCFSLIGIELATNALRQGLSVAVMMLAISLWGRSRAPSILLAGASVVLHSSAALVFFSLIIAAATWPRFVALMLGTIGLVYALIDSGLQPPLLEPFIYEVQKYLAHEDDEIYVRILSLAGVVGALAAPLLCTTATVRVRQLAADPSYAMALKLAMTCLPFLMLPYFGYRYVYGIYPIVLYLVLRASSGLDMKSGRLFVLVAAVNAAILLVWSHGSSYMHEVPFFD